MNPEDTLLKTEFKGKLNSIKKQISHRFIMLGK